MNYEEKYDPKQVAQLMNISDKTISKWERGQAGRLIITWAAIFGVSVDHHSGGWKLMNK